MDSVTIGWERDGVRFEVAAPTFDEAVERCRAARRRWSPPPAGAAAGQERAAARPAPALTAGAWAVLVDVGTDRPHEIVVAGPISAATLDAHVAGLFPGGAHVTGVRPADR